MEHTLHTFINKIRNRGFNAYFFTKTYTDSQFKLKV